MNIVIPSLLIENKNLLSFVTETRYIPGDPDSGSLRLIDAPDAGKYFIFEYSIYDRTYEFKEKNGVLYGSSDAKDQQQRILFFWNDLWPNVLQKYVFSNEKFFKKIECPFNVSKGELI